jgi:hypothetical protein
VLTHFQCVSLSRGLHIKINREDSGVDKYWVHLAVAKDPFLFCVFPVPCLVSIPRQSPSSFASHTLRIKVWETMQQSGEVASRLSGGVRLSPRWDNGSGGVGGFDHSSKPGG